MMSARAPVGASSRAELFVSARGKEDESKSPNGLQNDIQVEANFGVQEFKDDDQGPLQVEHMMGYAGDYRQTVVASVTNENVLIKR
jgi:hypothetical protein